MDARAACALDTFWPQLQAAAHRVLLLDYDGTLAPFQLERDRAFPYPGVRDILNKIQDAGRTRLIIISGRAVDDLQPLLGLDRLPELWGSHGFERQLPDGTLLTGEIEAGCLQTLERAYAWMIAHGHGPDCEKKPSSIAFHWRGAPAEKRPGLARTIRQAWTPFTAGTELAIHSFAGGLELRCAGVNKGRAVAKILQECDRDTVLAYLGDDLTDEDAFRTLQGHGLSVLVRDTYRDTAADCWLRPPGELLDFLRNWQIFSVK